MNRSSSQESPVAAWDSTESSSNSSNHAADTPDAQINGLFNELSPHFLTADDPAGNVLNDSLVSTEECQATSFQSWLMPDLLEDQVSNELSSLEVAQHDFPDRGLAVPELSVITAGLNIARLFGCEHMLWDVSSKWTLNLPNELTMMLPRDLRPTTAQLTIPHHPLFDLLPWPSVRTKLICVFSLDPELRPPSAREDLAVMNMVFDMEDSAEGLRITGPDASDGSAWEVGETFFNNWWWALDRDIIARSNGLRAQRGAPRLRLKNT